jgi:uncharacterized protein YciU (UPF0263 family)
MRRFALALAAALLAAPAIQAQDLPSTRIVDPAATVEEKLQVFVDREEIARIVVSLGRSYDAQD